VELGVDELQPSNETDVLGGEMTSQQTYETNKGRRKWLMRGRSHLSTLHQKLSFKALDKCTNTVHNIRRKDVEKTKPVVVLEYLHNCM